jgi:hypothetical protein
MSKSCFLFFLVLSFSSVFSYAQSITDTTGTLYDLAVHNVISLYNKTLQENTHLYNGAEYIEDHPGVNGSPYWNATMPQLGSIFYDGTLYPNIALAYDIAKEEVVIRNQQQLSVKLVPEKIDYFILFNQLFIQIKDEGAGSLQPGFYNVLNDGIVTVLSKRKKTPLRVLQPVDHYEFKEVDSYFIKKDQKYYAVDNKGSLMDALHDKKDEIKKFIQKNKFNFKKDLENSVVKTADYYNSINK